MVGKMTCSLLVLKPWGSPCIYIREAAAMTRWTGQPTARILSANLHKRVLLYLLVVSVANINELAYMPGMSWLLVTEYTARVFRLISDLDMWSWSIVEGNTIQVFCCCARWFFYIMMGSYACAALLACFSYPQQGQPCKCTQILDATRKYNSEIIVWTKITYDACYA